MKKRHLLVMAVLVVAISLVIAVPSSACTEGCTPGYWKNHTDEWMGFSPDASFGEVFGVGPDPDMTLLQALSAKNKDVGSGEEAALVRHAVAALLNAAHEDVQGAGVEDVMDQVMFAYGSGLFEYYKNKLEGWNELGCVDCICAD